MCLLFFNIILITCYYVKLPKLDIIGTPRFPSTVPKITIQIIHRTHVPLVEWEPRASQGKHPAFDSGQSCLIRARSCQEYLLQICTCIMEGEFDSQ